MDEDALAFSAIGDPLTAAFARGKRASYTTVLPLKHPAFLGQPEQTGWHGRERAIGLPALQPPMGGTLGGPLGAAGEITPAAAGDQDIAQRVDDLTKGRMRHATSPLGGLWRKQIGQKLPLQVA